MPYLTQKKYILDVPVLYNNLNTNNINLGYIQPNKVANAGGYKRILAGSWITSENGNLRLLDRAIVAANYTAGENQVIVNNPWAFLPGDVLHIIGNADENLLAEKNAVESGSAPVFGTVNSVNAGGSPMKFIITPASVAVNDIFKLKIEEIEVSFIATTTNVADVVKGLYDELTKNFQQSHHSSLEGLSITDNNTSLTLEAKEIGQIFLVSGSVVGSGTTAIAVDKGIGTLNITPGAGNADLAFGAKVGSINKPGLGIIASTLYLTDDDRQERLADYTVYDAGNINKKALLYLDGALVLANQTFKYIPRYGN